MRPVLLHQAVIGVANRLERLGDADRENDDAAAVERVVANAEGEGGDDGEPCENSLSMSEAEGQIMSEAKLAPGVGRLQGAELQVGEKDHRRRHGGEAKGELADLDSGEPSLASAMRTAHWHAA